MLTEFIYITFLILLLGRSIPKNRALIQVKLDHLTLIRLYANLGDYKKLLTYLNKHSQYSIINLIRKTLFLGTFSHQHILDIETLLYQSQKHYQHNERFFELLRFRITFTLITMLIVRYIFTHFYMGIFWPKQYLYYDKLCLISSLILILLSLFFFKYFLPTDWFWSNNISKQGLYWGETLLLNQAKPQMTYHHMWLLLNTRMLEYGINLAEEKRNLLFYWAWEERKKNRIKQEKFMDLFPLFEIFGFILPSFLMVIIPGYLIFNI